ncbi:MAG: hypothetical protein QGG42_16855 [Phycisphaerae bacterium]|jgi:hypothetical protein|nr:hypothetical protein [Phycisphaerae bacterium]
MGFWGRLFGFKVETGRCRECCRSDYYCCDRPLSENEEARFERISQMFCANKSPEDAIAILIEEDSWHPRATANCVSRWYGELTEGQGYAPRKPAKKPRKRQRSKLDKLLNRHPDPIREKPWAILTTRFGDHKKSPTPGDLSAALNELYHEIFSYMTPEDYAKHPNACLRCGFDDGTMYVLDIDRTERLIFQQWADQDFENQLAPQIEIEKASQQQVDRLWGLLINGYVDKVKTKLKSSD